jgi:hypothetical protein
MRIDFGHKFAFKIFHIFYRLLVLYGFEQKFPLNIFSVYLQASISVYISRTFDLKVYFLMQFY